MDEPEKKPVWPEEQPSGWPDKIPGWLDWAIIVVLVVALVIAAIIILGPYQTGLFNQVNNNL